MNNRVVSRVVNLISTDGFIVETEGGKSQPIDKANTIKLAKSGKLSNVEVVLGENGEDLLLIDEGMSQLPSIRNTLGEKLTLAYRIVDADGKCIGYKVSNGKGQLKKLSIKKVWELAVNDHIDNVKAYISNNKLVISSINNFRLSDLPRISN